jgi:hypothetical protein
MEMSYFHHHLWHTRSRMGAWDHSNRGHKQFIDRHIKANLVNQRLFQPSILGWWALVFWSGPNSEPTFSDDIEYLCAKMMAGDNALALMGIDPASYANKPGVKRLGDLIGRYERLRLANAVPESIKAKLREPGRDFTLVEDGGHWAFRPVHYAKHKIVDATGADRRWSVENPHAAQPARLRLEALLAARPYGEAGAVLNVFEQTESGAAEGVSAQAAPAAENSAWLAFRARNAGAPREKAWCYQHRLFAPPLNLMAENARVAVQGQAQLEGVRQTVGLGLWVRGDGNGQTLALRLRSPAAVSGAIADHYVVVDFTGWRYFELIEPDAERVNDYLWPQISEWASWMNSADDLAVVDAYAVYRQSVDFTRIETARLWYHHLPAGREVCCLLKPIKILPLVSVKLRRPTVRVGAAEIVFPVELESGQYLEYDRTGPAIVYGRDGAEVKRVTPQGAAPLLQAGRNELNFTCEPSLPVIPRARVTVSSLGEIDHR